MSNTKNPRRILWYENIGFLAMILLSWANELLDLPKHILGGSTHTNWRESVIETLLILIVWGAVHAVTRSLMTRLFYLEDFLQICAWCRRIGHDDEWLPVEKFFAKGFDVKTTHGICPDCAKKMQPDEPEPN